MPLLTLANVSIAFGGPRLLDGVDLRIDQGSHACLVGRNGTGKTTLLRIMAGETEADTGEVIREASTVVSYLPQVVPTGIEGCISDVVIAGARHKHNEWETQHEAERLLTMMGLDGAQPFEELSGGMKRRTLLARALVSRPDVLLLDEPTNHLDIESIRWLEGFLQRHVATFLFITHDRLFLRRLATRIIDLDRGKLVGWDCDYDTFLERKQAVLEDEAARNRRFDERLSAEEVWIRQGIKARRTRDEGRVRALKDMRSQRDQRRSESGNARIQVQEAGRSGALVVKAEDVSFAYDQAPVVKHLTTTIMRGDRVGVIGPNGCGKTTLLRLLLGEYAMVAADDAPTAGQRAVVNHRADAIEAGPREQRGLAPSRGTIQLGTRLEVAYFDQHRHILDDSAPVFDNINHGSDSVMINGNPRNVYGYLQEFLFTPDRARTPVSVLSGGERNRLLLAKLFARPANLIVMDEPTNDLDVETLELLEEQLLNYSGTLILVSHDRTFINNVVTSVLGFDPDGTVREVVGGYDEWERSCRAAASTPRKGGAKTTRPPARTKSRKALTYKEKRTLEALPKQIEALETEQEALTVEMARPEFYRQGPATIVARQERLTAIAAEIETAYAQWDDLDSRR